MTRAYRAETATGSTQNDAIGAVNMERHDVWHRLSDEHGNLFILQVTAAADDEGRNHDLRSLALAKLRDGEFVLVDGLRHVIISRAELLVGQHGLVIDP